MAAATKTATVHSEIDIIIAGAGMAGTTLALALKQGGLQPLLIEPVPLETQVQSTFDGRSSAIAYAAFRQWRTLGVGQTLEPVAQRIEQILVTDSTAPGAAARAPMTGPFLRFESAEIGDESGGEPLGYMIENRQIRAALAGAVQAAGISVLAPARIVDVSLEPGRAFVTLEDGATVSAPLVVGAEGRDSAVRKAARIPTVGWSYGQSGVVATIRLEHPHHGVAHEYFLPSGPFAILPLTDQRASLVWTETPKNAAALASAGDAMFHAHLARRFGPFLGRVERVGPTFVYPLSLSLADSMTKPRAVLLGDAAHGVHPIAGQGLNLGLKDAAALAQVLVEARWLGEDIGAVTVLERYARWRRFDTVALATATDLFTRLFANDDPFLRLVRGVGIAAVNRIGPVRRFFMQDAGGATGDLPRLLRGEAL